MNKRQRVRDGWNKYCGDKDLWKKWSHIIEVYTDGTEGEPQQILSISRYEGGIKVNADSGNFPFNNWLRGSKKTVLVVEGGFKIKHLKLVARQQTI